LSNIEKKHSYIRTSTEGMEREGTPEGMLEECAFKNMLFTCPFMKRQFLQKSKTLRSIKRTEKEKYGIA
jgi:hypothetical protein